MQIERFCEGLLSFLQASPTPFHAVQTMALALEQTGFKYLDEAEDWHYPSSGSYYTIRNDASIIAFRLGQDGPNRDTHERLGFNMVGAHTDSPGLKIKPNPDVFSENYWQLGVETYGSPLLHTWFDRDLSIAGRVHYIDENNGLCRALVDFEHPIATIPSLAIHLNRTANEKSSINPQKHVLPVLMQTDNPETFSLKRALLERLSHSSDHVPQEVLDFDLYLYDSQPARSTGSAQEFIASARLDNLLSCYVGLMSLINSDPNQRSLLVCNDHEEVGSQSACGAQGPFLADTLKRLFPDYETYCQCIAQSFLISVDNAHAIHPNYRDRHDPKHAPRMNQGPAIKINANQRYATTSETSAVVQYLAQVVKVPLQSFVSRSDLACGSTIGPLTSSELGVRTVDMGVPQFAMHSIREMASKADAHHLFQLLNAFFSLPAVPSAQAIRPEITRTQAPETDRKNDDERPRPRARSNQPKASARRNSTPETPNSVSPQEPVASGSSVTPANEGNSAHDDTHTEAQPTEQQLAQEDRHESSMLTAEDEDTGARPPSNDQAASAPQETERQSNNRHNRRRGRGRGNDKQRRDQQNADAPEQPKPNESEEGNETTPETTTPATTPTTTLQSQSVQTGPDIPLVEPAVTESQQNDKPDNGASDTETPHSEPSTANDSAGNEPNTVITPEGEDKAAEAALAKPELKSTNQEKHAPSDSDSSKDA